MQEMSATVQEVSENSNRAAEASRNAAEIARRGGTIVEDTLKKMRAIEVLSVGAKGYIRKPFTPGQLKERVTPLIGSGK